VLTVSGADPTFSPEVTPLTFFEVVSVDPTFALAFTKAVAIYMSLIFAAASLRLLVMSIAWASSTVG